MPVPEPETPNRSFHGKYHPYILVTELRDLLNAAADGKSRWKTAPLREQLLSLEALIQKPAERRHAPRTSRRLWVTTPRLLRDKAPELYAAILISFADE